MEPAAVRRGAAFVRRVLLGSPTAVVGTALLAVHLGLALLGPTLAPNHYAQFNILHTLEPPSRAFWGGTDQFGRDQLSRVMWGARATLLLATASTLLGVGLGVVVGMAGAFYRGLLDEVLMRIVDALMALPALLLAMLLLDHRGRQSGLRRARYRRGLHAALGARPAGRRPGPRGLRVHRRGPGPGRARTVHHLRRDAAERLGVHHRGADDPIRLRDPARHLARLPRPRGPAAGPGLGPHDQRGAPVPGPGAVARHPARGRHLDRRGGGQPGGRRPPRGAGPPRPGGGRHDTSPGPSRSSRSATSRWRTSRPADRSTQCGGCRSRFRPGGSWGWSANPAPARARRPWP